MQRVLKRKQSLKPEDESFWWEVIDNIENYISVDEVLQKTTLTMNRIKQVCNGKKVGYSWSGGKDSLVLSHIMTRLGITKSQCLITDLEYPTWRTWLEDNAPDNCEVKYIGYDLQFLKEHPEMIFAKGKDKEKWNRLVQRNHFESFCRERNLDICCVGHRTIDGNCTGKDGIRQKKGFILYAPLFDWTHEELFGYMHYNGIQIPFIYKWYRGFYEGTHWWPYRYADSIEQGYKEVFAIDPQIVYDAAKVLPSAREFLEVNGLCRQ